MEKYVFYLVGTVWYSALQGDMSNTSAFPSFHTFSADEAERKYEEFLKREEDWSDTFNHAYMMGALPDGTFELIKGRTNPKGF